MAKTNHFKTVIFNQDFALKKKGEEWQCDTLLAHQLVSFSKVAEYKNEPMPVVIEKPVMQELKKQKNKKEK